jgi:hypothetical protein
LSGPDRQLRARDRDVGIRGHAADHAALTTLRDVFDDARERGDDRPAFTLLAACLDELGVALPERREKTVSLEEARDDWMRRLRSANRSASALAAYRAALADLIDFLDRTGRTSSLFVEETIVAYLDDYRERRRPGARNVLPPLHSASLLLPLAQRPRGCDRSVPRPRSAEQAAPRGGLADRRRVRAPA